MERVSGSLCWVRSKQSKRCFCTLPRGVGPLGDPPLNLKDICEFIYYEELTLTINQNRGCRDTASTPSRKGKKC